MHKSCFSVQGKIPSRFFQSLLATTSCLVVGAVGQVTIDGDFSDWESIGSGGGEAVVPVDVPDPADLGDSSGDIARIGATVEGDVLVLTMESHGVTAPSVDDTPEGKSNRYYYHWLIDTDNNPATGVNNGSYENTPTGIDDPIGTEIIVQFGWRDGATNGVYAYSPLDPDETALISDYPWEMVGNAIEARIPLDVLGLVPGQTVSISAFQEGASDDWAVDFMESGELKIPSSSGSSTNEVQEVADAADLGDSSGDIARISAVVEGSNLILTMASHGVIAPSVDETPEGKSNRYYYHWLIDTDNNPGTGVNNSTYENVPTGIADPIGTEIIVQFGWRDGATNGVYAYSPLDPDETALISDYPWENIGNEIKATIPLEALGLVAGQTVSISAFQEGASDGWATDWMESIELKIPASTATPAQEVADAADLGDSSGDIAKISAAVDGANLILTMASHGVIAPSVDETPEGKSNRYYYHWLIDTDNNPGTGVNNSTYENVPTGIADPIGTEIIVQFGWRDGATNGVYAYSPLDPDETALISDYPWENVGDEIKATIPLEALGLVAGQTVSISAFQEGASDGWATDWMESIELKIPSASGGGANTNIIVVDDPTDDMLDPSGDIRQVRATTDGEYLYLGLSVEGIIAPGVDDVAEGLSNRYYYHWIVDADNNPGTGVNNGTYENNPTGVVRTIGTEIIVQLGWRDGAPDGVYAYDPTDPDEGSLVSDYEWAAMGDSFEARLPLAELNLAVGQKVSISAFQEGASDGWATDWMESDELTLSAPGSGGGVDLSQQVFADGYGFQATLEDSEGITIDPATVSATLDGADVVIEATKDGSVTTVAGTFAEWLAPGGEHTLSIRYPGGSTDLPVVVPDYTVIPATYGVKALDGVPRGFAINVAQVSDMQAEGASAHGNQLEKAEQQLAGTLISAEGKPFYNEASGVENGWAAATTTIDGMINWAEDAPTEAGNFNSSSTQHTDVPIPLVGNVANGLVVEALAYLELEAGYHRLGLNTIGGYKASMGPDGRDRLSPVLGSYEDAVNYSFLGDKYFDVLVPEAGFYPIRVLFTHSTRTKEGASMELFSLQGARRVPINDPNDPDSIKAYQFLGGDATYVSHVSPTPGTDYARPNTSVDLTITQGGVDVVPGSVSMKFDGSPVTPLLESDGDAIHVRYFPGALDYAGSYEVEFAYTLALDPPLQRQETFDFGVYRGATVLPAEWASPVDSAGEPGFQARVVQNPGPRGNSISAAEAQLAGQGTFTATKTVPVMNFGGGGLFEDALDFATETLLGDGGDQYFSMEVLTHLHLQPGAYTFGVNSDDGFVASVGRLTSDKTIILDGWDSGRGIEDNEPQDLFDVVVRQEGLYAFRLVYFQGTGGASLEWYQYDRATETATLLNTEGAPAAYHTRTVEPMAFAGPRLSAPASADLGSIAVTSSGLQSGFILHNTGSEALQITSATLGGDDMENFTVTDFPSSIAAGEAGAVKVRFDANGVAGGYRTTLELTTNDPDHAMVSIVLSAGALDPLGPVAHYALDEGAGESTMRDRSGNQRDGTFNAGDGTIGLGQEGLASGSAVAFSGGSYANVSGDRFGRWEDFTLSAWVNANTIGEAPQMIFGKGDPFGGNPNFALLFSETGLLWFAGSEPEFGSDPGVMQAGQSHHVTVSYLTSAEDRVIQIYVDGQVVAEQTDPTFIATGVNEPLFLGAFNGAVALDGVLDDVQLYDRALTEADILTLYENPGQSLASEIDPVDPEPSGDGVAISSVIWSAGGFETTFSTEDGVTYELQYSPNLEPGSWTTVGSVTGNGGDQVLADSDEGRVTDKAGYYRILTP